MEIVHANSVNLNGKIFKLLTSFGIYIALVTVIIVFSVLNKSFLTTSNIMNMIVQSSIIAIVGIGQTLVILTGGIDLSVGSVVAFIGIAAGLMMNAGFNVVSVILFSLFIGLVLGFINGSIVAYGGVPSFIVTLGMMGIARGGALAINNGQPIAGFSQNFKKISELYILHVIPIYVFYCIILFALVYILLTKTCFGRHIYALGGNRITAWLSGVNVKRVEVWVYMLCGLFTAFAALMLASRMNYATPTAANDYNTDSIAAVVMGGTAMIGGRGNVLGTFVGALFLGVLRNGLTIINVSDYLQEIIIGIVIILAVFLDRKKD